MRSPPLEEEATPACAEDVEVPATASEVAEARNKLRNKLKKEKQKVAKKAANPSSDRTTVKNG